MLTDIPYFWLRTKASIKVQLDSFVSMVDRAALTGKHDARA